MSAPALLAEAPGLTLSGRIGAEAVHLCIDMQRLFGPGSPWAVPWLPRVLEPIARLARHGPAHTVFTRFLPPERPEDMPGAWQDYYRKWSSLTRERLAAEWLELAPPLDRLVPPARLLDKSVYSPWTEGRLDALLSGSGVRTLIVSGGETDVCVLTTVLGAIDRGYRVVLARDALCSAFDATHDAVMTVFRTRFSSQLEIADVDEILGTWRP